jgi:ubiquinone/menaquinone biosynthesis C-methylase UbiE
MIRFALKYAQDHDFTVNLAIADASYLPYADNSFDWAISIATYHHLTHDRERKIAIEELKRILKPKGEAFITVWNRWQPSFWFKGKELSIPWRQKDKTLYRYYYLFSYSELEKLMKKAGLVILKSFPENSYHFPMKQFSRNICLLVKKECRR